MHTLPESAWWNMPEKSAGDAHAAAAFTPEDVRRLRKKHRIYVRTADDGSSSATGARAGASAGLADGDVPVPLRTFDELAGPPFGVERWIVDNVREHLKFEAPTPIQCQAIPCILTGRPVLAAAPTGSGKTIAFLLPLIVLLRKPAKQFLRALIIQPSRELAVQTMREFEVLRGAKKFKCRLLHTTTGDGDGSRLDLGVSTALKLVQMLHDGIIHFKHLRHLILDEADKLLDMGFAPQLDEILSFIPVLSDVQFLMFSATIPGALLRLAEPLLRGGSFQISIGTPMTANPDVEQELMYVSNDEGKLVAFRQMIHEGKIEAPALIFLSSVQRAKSLFRELLFDRIFVDVMHADRTKKERDRVVNAFRESKIWFLLCTDLMSRGVDFKGVKTVLSWDMPPDDVSYIHRVGRTGRAGATGKAITFFTTEDIQTTLPRIVTVFKRAHLGERLPEWMLQLKRQRKRSQLGGGTPGASKQGAPQRGAKPRDAPTGEPVKRRATKRNR